MTWFPDNNFSRFSPMKLLTLLVSFLACVPALQASLISDTVDISFSDDSYSFEILGASIQEGAYEMDHQIGQENIKVDLGADFVSIILDDTAGSLAFGIGGGPLHFLIEDIQFPGFPTAAITGLQLTFISPVFAAIGIDVNATFTDSTISINIGETALQGSDPTFGGLPLQHNGAIPMQLTYQIESNLGVIPEPSTLGWFGLAALAFFLLVRHRSSHPARLAQILPVARR